MSKIITKVSPVCFVLAFVFLFLGCGGEAAVEETTAPKEKTHSVSMAQSRPSGHDDGSEESASTHSAKEGKLGFIPLRRLPYEALEIPVMDSLVLYGRLYDPSQKPESENEDEDSEEEEDEEDGEEPQLTEKYPLVILLHALGGGQGDWEQLPARLVHEGYAVLAVDQRGHGKSAQPGQSWRGFKSKEWQRFSADTIRMMAFFDESEDYPQVDASRVGLIGASIGANVALITSARDNATEHRVQAVVTLSAGLKYKGLEVTKSIYRYKNPLMMIASQNDKYAFESTQMLNRLHTGVKSIKLYKNIGHGTDMIRFFPELQTEIVQWLVGSLPPTSAPIIYPSEDDEEGEDDEDE